MFKIWRMAKSIITCMSIIGAFPLFMKKQSCLLNLVIKVLLFSISRYYLYFTIVVPKKMTLFLFYMLIYIDVDFFLYCYSYLFNCTLFDLFPFYSYTIIYPLIYLIACYYKRCCQSSNAVPKFFLFSYQGFS